MVIFFERGEIKNLWSRVRVGWYLCRSEVLAHFGEVSKKSNSLS